MNNTFGTAFVSNQGTDGFGVGSQSEGGAGVTGLNGALDNDPTPLAPNLILLTFAPAPIFLDTDLGLNRVWKTEWEMLNNKDGSGVAPGSLEGARSATGGEPGAAVEVKRWSAGRKKEVVLRLLRGEPVDAISREVSVPIFKLEQWRDRALAGIDAGLKERENDPVVQQLDDANRRIGELVMEVEILQKERRAKRPLVGRRSSR